MLTSMHFRLSLVLGALCIGPFSLAQAPTGIEGGLYYPSNASVRNAFGSQWNSIGPASVTDPKFQALGVTPTFDIITSRQNGNRLTLVPVTWGATQALGDRTGTVPYIRYGIGLYYADYRVGTESARIVGGTATAEIGVVFNRTFRLAARYDVYTQRDGYRFDGLMLSASVNLFRW
jgi:hypothetical protein